MSRLKKSVEKTRNAALVALVVSDFFIATLNQNLIAIAKHQCTEPIPFRFKDPCAALWQFINSLGEHGQDGRGYR